MTEGGRGRGLGGTRRSWTGPELTETGRIISILLLFCCLSSSFVFFFSFMYVSVDPPFVDDLSRVPLLSPPETLPSYPEG